MCRPLSGVLAAILLCAWLLSFCVFGLVCDTGLRPCKLEMFEFQEGAFRGQPSRTQLDLTRDIAGRRLTESHKDSNRRVTWAILAAVSLIQSSSSTTRKVLQNLFNLRPVYVRTRRFEECRAFCRYCSGGSVSAAVFVFNGSRLFTITSFAEAFAGPSSKTLAR